jgi:hypothetical protein
MDEATKRKWHERWQRLIRYTPAATVVLIILLGQSLYHGYEARRDHLDDLCDVLIGHDFSSPDHPIRDPHFWRHAGPGKAWDELRGDELRKAIGEPDNPYIFIDHRWGIAYAALNDPGHDWTYREDMDQATQADMVRYICFRAALGLWKRYSWPNDVYNALDALDTYPDAALEANQARLNRTLRMVLEANLSLVPAPAQEFLFARLDKPWVRDILWDALAHHKPASREQLLGSGPRDDEWDRSNALQILWEKAKAGNSHAAELVLRFAEYEDRPFEEAYRKHKAVVAQWREAIKTREGALRKIAEKHGEPAATSTARPTSRDTP